MENSQTISRKDLAKIYRISCGGWQSTFNSWLDEQKFSEDIELTDRRVNHMFDAADEKQTKVLLKYLKKPESPYEKVGSYEDALKINGEKCTITESDTPDEVAYKKLKTITKALNGGRFVDKDYLMKGNYCYVVWFYLDSAGFGCVTAHLRVSASSASCGFRLCFFESKTRDYAMNKFKDLYEQFYTA